MPLVHPSSAEDLAHHTSALHSKVDYFSHHWEPRHTFATQRLIWYRRDLLEPLYTPLDLARCENLLWRIQHLLLNLRPNLVEDCWRNRFEKWNRPLVGPLHWAHLCEVSSSMHYTSRRRASYETRSCPHSPPFFPRCEILKPALKRTVSNQHAPTQTLNTEHVCLHRLKLDHLDLAGRISHRQLNNVSQNPWDSYVPMTPPSPALSFTSEDTPRKKLRFRFNLQVKQAVIVDKQQEGSNESNRVIQRSNKNLLTPMDSTPIKFDLSGGDVEVEDEGFSETTLANAMIGYAEEETFSMPTWWDDYDDWEEEDKKDIKSGWVWNLMTEVAGLVNWASGIQV